MARFGYSLLVAGFGALLVWVLASSAGSIGGRIFANPFMVATGRYSYALYLIHVPVVSTVFRLFREPHSPLAYEAQFLLFGALAFALSWGSAFASWHVLEKHILALKKYFSYN